MATELKALPETVHPSAETRRIAQLAEQSAHFHAQRWFTRERAWINEQQLQLCRIPAPTFFEQQRAEWFRAQLESLGWKAITDRAGNVLATSGNRENERCFVVSAHLDTVLAPNRAEEIYYAPDGRLCGPGVSDNGSGLAAFEISFNGPGGHSWNDYGTPNPVHALTEAVSFFVQSADSRMNGERKCRCSYNFGLIEGGTSINSIPSSARAKLDLRSEDPGLLDSLFTLLNSAAERGLERENRGARATRLAAKIRDLGSRPGGKLAEHSPLLRTVQAVDAQLHIRSRLDCASTDANIPLSLGVPAISIGTVGQGGGAHTSQEWYQPDGRELGLRRILLILEALAEANELSEQTGISAAL